MVEKSSFSLPDWLTPGTIVKIAVVLVSAGGITYLDSLLEKKRAGLQAATTNAPTAALATATAEATELPTATATTHPAQLLCVGLYDGPGTTLWSAWNENGRPESVTVVYPDETRNLIINLGNGEKPYGVLPSDYPPGTCLEIANP